MLRQFMLSGVLAGAIVVVGVTSGARKPAVAQSVPRYVEIVQNTSPTPANAGNAGQPSEARQVAQGTSTAAAQSLGSPKRREATGDPVVVPAGRLRLLDIQDV